MWILKYPIKMGKFLLPSYFLFHHFMKCCHLKTKYENRTSILNVPFVLCL